MALLPTFAEWPYPHPPPVSGLPTWDCPTGECMCHRADPGDTLNQRIRFFDHLGRRMARARCRLWVGSLAHSILIADSNGEVNVALPRHVRTLSVQWAPEDTPLLPHYPYQTVAYLDLGEDLREGVRRRLHNLGFPPTVTESTPAGPQVMHALQHFSIALRHAAGTAAPDPARAIETLRRIHDDGVDTLLPSTPAAPELPSLEDLAGFLATSASPAAARADTFAYQLGALNPWPTDAWLRGQSFALLERLSAITVSPFGLNQIRVRVRTRRHGPLAGATVTLQGLVTLTTSTLTTGEVTFPPLLRFGASRITAFFHHHGPDPGAGARVTTGPVSVELPGFLTATPPPTPAATVTHHFGIPPITLVEITLMDAGINFGGVKPLVARALTEQEVRDELLVDVFKGDITLEPNSDFIATHDPNSGALDACTANCNVVGPAPGQGVAVPPRGPPSMGGVSIVHSNRPTDASAVADGSHFQRDIVSTRPRNDQHIHPFRTTLDQRLLVGVVRLCKHIKQRFGLNVLYHAGFLTTNRDAHDDGRAVDIRGFATEMPPFLGGGFRVRLGVDFLVLLHWGRFPSWDPTTTSAQPNPSNLDIVPGTWRRLSAPDTTTDFRPPPNGTMSNPGRLRFRLLGLPANVPLQHMTQARTIFMNVFDFLASEFTDKITQLPTPKDRALPAIDIHDAENVIHPDHANPRLRRTHDDHFHVQFGPTHTP